MKKLLVLGAGVYQVPLIKKIKEMGIYCIVSSIKGNYPGFAYADKVYYENTTDMEAILKIARDEKIDGILTTGTDVAVKTIGYVCEMLKLNGISRSSAEYTTNKSLMKEKLIEGGVRTADFEIAYQLNDAIRIAHRLGFPVMFKCVDKSGSRGIIKVETEKDVPDAFNYSLSYSDCEYIVIEKFLNGYEIGIDGYVNSDQRVILPHGKIMHYNGKTKVPIGHTFPFECNQVLYDDIIRQTNKAIDALKLDHCFFNVDAMIDGDQCYFIEIGGRTGATCIPELASIYLGSDYYEKMIYNALGESVDQHDPVGMACAGQLLRAPKTGRIVDIQLPELGEDAHISVDFKKGEHVNAFNIGPDRIGQITVAGENTTKAMERLREIEQMVKIEIAED